MAAVTLSQYPWLRNNFSGWVGFQLTVSNTPLTVTHLGRWVVSGNSGNHAVKLVNADGTDVANGSKTVSTAGQPAGQFAYAALASPVTLSANTTYYLVSQEVEGGDQWYDYSSCYLTTSGAATANWPAWAYNDSQTYTIYTYAPQQSYGPVNLKYQARSAYPSDNYAALLAKNNVTIQGTTPGTTLVAFNRDTTIFYIGSGHYGYPSGSQAVTNILLQNITFQGNPTIDYTGNYNPTGIMWANNLGGLNIPLGAMVVFGGYFHPDSAVTNHYNVLFKGEQ